MNYDNIHTTEDILKAFQGCRDAGKEIDLFETLAWRDEPPIDAFIEIVRKIKLEPLLALATQSLGWVKNTEILEGLKKSNELLEILSNLVKSGDTYLIQWSAAKSIMAIGFDFINVSQYLSETPQNTIRRIELIYKSKGSMVQESWVFWTYSDALKFCSVIYSFDPLSAKNFVNGQVVS
jgi:hypothetical protein